MALRWINGKKREATEAEWKAFLATQRSRHRVWYEKQRAKGLCVSCGKEPVVVGRTRCSVCLALRSKVSGHAANKEAFKKLSKQKEKLVRRLRKEVVAALGGACSCCGEREPLFMTIDHEKRDGHAERNQQARIRMYRAVIAGKRPDIRVLCFNCNLGRELNGGVCPHAMMKLAGDGVAAA